MSEMDRGLPHTPTDLAVIRNPKVFDLRFKGKYTGVQNLLLTNIIGADNVYREVDSSTRRSVIDEIQMLFEDGPASAGRQIQTGIYNPFAFDQGFTEETEWGDAAIPLAQLTEQQRAAWENYLTSVSFMGQRRGLVAQVLRNVRFPSISTKYKPANVPLAASLEEVKREIVGEFIPNITDDEAKLALGRRYTAETIRSEVTPDWFV